MSTDENTRDSNGTTLAYIGSSDCEIASCPHKQEFPDGDSDRCLIHALENSILENKQLSDGEQQ